MSINAEGQVTQQEATNVLSKIFDGKIPDELMADLSQEKDEIEIEHTSHQMMEHSPQFDPASNSITQIDLSNN